MTFIRTTYLTVGEAKDLEHKGFILKFVGFTLKGPMYDVFAMKQKESIDDATPEEWDKEGKRWIKGDYD